MASSTRTTAGLGKPDRPWLLASPLLAFAGLGGFGGAGSADSSTGLGIVLATPAAQVMWEVLARGISMVLLEAIALVGLPWLVAGIAMAAAYLTTRIEWKRSHPLS